MIRYTMHHAKLTAFRPCSLLQPPSVTNSISTTETSRISTTIALVALLVALSLFGKMIV
jgi:hypothetical protein